MADVSPEMARAGLEFAAQEHHDAAKLQAKVDAMGGQTASDAPAADQAPATPAALPDETTLKLCRTLLNVADRVVVNFTVPELKLEPAELEQIAVAAVPVLDKHLPGWLQQLTATPEGQLVLVVALIYASKAPAVLERKPPPKKTEVPKAAETPTVAAAAGPSA